MSSRPPEGLGDPGVDVRSGEPDVVQQGVAQLALLAPVARAGA